MYYCESCRVKKGWPTSLLTSRGTCEICNVATTVYDQASSRLPEPPPRPLNMGDLLRSPHPNPKLNDLMDTPPVKPDYSHLSESQRELYEYRDEHGCSLQQAIKHFREIREERERLDELNNLNKQLSEAGTVEELKPVLQAILDKLWS